MNGINLFRISLNKNLLNMLIVYSHEKELKTEVEKTAEENQLPDSVENKVPAK
jgi:hypothetical protein